MLIAVAIGAAALIGAELAAHAGRILLVIFAGILLALFLSGAARAAARVLHLPYGLRLTLVVLVLLGLTVGMCFWLGPRVAAESSQLIDRVPRTASDLIGAERLKGWLHAVTRLRGEGGTHAVETAMATASGIARWAIDIVAGFVVFLFIGVYGAAQPDVYERALVRLVPVAHRRRGQDVIHAIAHALRRWLFGRVVAMVFVGVGTAIAFWLIGLPLPLALGVLAGLLSFIEYIGAILSAAPALLLALDGGPLTVVWVLVIYTAVHALEGYLLTPLLARRTVSFPPGFTLAVQVVLGAFFGILGLMLATPLAVVLVFLVRMLYVEGVLETAGGRQSEGAADPARELRRGGGGLPDEDGTRARPEG